MAGKPLEKLKQEMVFNLDLARLVDVMKGIAASQYHAMERKMTSQEAYTNALDACFKFYDFRALDHPFLRPKNGRKLICIVTTDGGFLGGLNMKVLQVAMKQEGEDPFYVVIGERGANYVREFGRKYVSFPGINTDETRFTLVRNVAFQMFKKIVTENFGRALIIYPFPVSFTVQRIEVLELVPCPLFSEGRPQTILSQEEQLKQAILESPQGEMIEYLTFLWMQKKFLEIFEHAKLAEFGARTMHLEESYQTITKLNKQLRLEFFKARRQKIDQSLRESFTSRLVCGKGEKEELKEEAYDPQ